MSAPRLEPLHHFRVESYADLSLFGLDISISNSVIWMWLAVLAAFLFTYLPLRRPAIVPGRWQGLAEAGYAFVKAMVERNIDPKGHRYLPLIMGLFYFILFCNLLGLVPGAYTPTSQLIVTGTLAVSVFAFTVALRFVHHGMSVLRTFAPKGLPIFLLPLMIPIELISFLARPVSLAVRLFANMTAGHTVLAVLAFFSLALPWFASWIPLGFSIVLHAVEIFIGFIQAYIFAVLSCVYIDDAINPH